MDHARECPQGPIQRRKTRSRLIHLAPYQRDALRLIIRDFLRPSEIPKDVWYALKSGDAEQVYTAHLDAIAGTEPELYSALRFWRLGRESL